MFKQEIWFSEHEYRAMTPKIARMYFAWYEWYQHWMDMKEMYYSPDYSPEKYKKIWYDSLFGPNKSNGEAERSPRVILQKMREMQ